MATPTEMARQAQTDVSLLRREFELFSERFKNLELQKLREANAILEEKVAKLEKRVEAADQLAERIAVLESQHADAKKAREEGEKRQWQLIFIAVGALFALVGGVIGQLLLSAVKPTGSIPPK